MNKLLSLAAAMLVAFGGSALALEVGEKVGMVWVDPGGIVCDTAAQAEQAIDTSAPLPAGCGRLLRQAPAFIEAISEYEFGDAAYMILKITFLPPAPLGVQYGWETHSKAPDAISGDSA